MTGDEALVPGPGHSAEDRSLSIKFDDAAPDGFVVHSFAGDDPIACRDYVRSKLGLPEFESKKKGKINGGAQPYSPTVAKYVYRLADGTPYLQVQRTATKQFSNTVGMAKNGSAASRRGRKCLTCCHS